MDFGDRPEIAALLGVAVFVLSLRLRHERNSDFPAVYRLVGSLVLLLSLLSLAEWGRGSFLPGQTKNIELFYEFAGLLISAGLISLGIVGSGFRNIFSSQLSDWWEFCWWPR